MPLGSRIKRWAATKLLPETMIVTRAPAAGARVALTFDDGPDDQTRALLDLLDQLAVRATFFVVGARCAERPDDLRQIVDRGHELAGHGYTHTRFPLLARDQLSDELDRTAALLPAPKRRRALIRPPGGHNSVRTLVHLYARGYTAVMWSTDSRDARTRDPDEIVAAASQAQGGDIVLLHEGQDWTRAALPAIVRNLRARGLDCAPVGQLI